MVLPLPTKLHVNFVEIKESHLLTANLAENRTECESVAAFLVFSVHLKDFYCVCVCVCVCVYMYVQCVCAVSPSDGELRAMTP